MKKKNLFTLAVTALYTLVSGTIAHAALNLEGQSGVFLNTLAYTNALGKYELSSHQVNLDNLGSVSTYNIAFGAAKNVELGYTRVSSSVSGVKDQDVLLGKWLAVDEKESSPAIGLWLIRRSLTGGSDSTDIGVSATKIVKLAGKTAVIDLGARSTKALGLGLFGFGNSRKLKFEGSAAVFVTNKFIVGTEFKQQIVADTWTDIAFRYIASESLNLDVGFADLGPGLGNQFAFAATYGW